MGAINVPKDVKVEFIEPAKPCLSFAIFDKYTVIAGRIISKPIKITQLIKTSAMTEFKSNKIHNTIIE